MLRGALVRECKVSLGSGKQLRLPGEASWHITTCVPCRSRRHNARVRLRKNKLAELIGVFPEIEKFIAENNDPEADEIYLLLTALAPLTDRRT